MKKDLKKSLDSSKLIMKVLTLSDFDKYSLKKRDFQGERFKNNDDLINFFDILSLSKPEIISEQVERYLKSGADIITTNTENSNRFSLSKYALEDLTYELNYAATKLCREKVAKYDQITRNKPRFVAGTMSNISDKIDFSDAVSIYSEQIKAMLASKVDMFFLKNISNELSYKAIFEAVDNVMLKRKKFTYMLMTVDEVFLSEIENIYASAAKYSNFELISVGKTFELNNIEKIEDNFMLINCKSASEAKIERISNIEGVEKLKVLAVQKNITPEMIERIKF